MGLFGFFGTVQRRALTHAAVHDCNLEFNKMIAECWKANANKYYSDIIKMFEE